MTHWNTAYSEWTIETYNKKTHQITAFELDLLFLRSIILERFAISLHSTLLFFFRLYIVLCVCYVEKAG